MRVYINYLSLFLCLLVGFAVNPVLAADEQQEGSICRVVDVSGSPKLQQKGGEPVVPVAGSEVYDGDIISTLAGESVRIVCSCGACSNCGLRHLRYGDAEKAMATPVQKDVVCCGFGEDGSVGEVVNVKGGVKVQRATSGAVETVEDGTRIYFDDVLMGVDPGATVEVWFYRASRQLYDNLSGSGVKIDPLQIPVGKISSLSGNIKVQRATGEVIVPEKGDWLFDHDKILSSADSKLGANYSCGPNINYGGNDPAVNHISKVTACCLVKPVANYAWLAPLAIAALIPDDPRPRPPAANPAIDIQANAVSGSPFSQPGDIVQFEYEVTNSGNTNLDNIIVIDPDGKVTGITCPQTSLASGESMTCTASYVVTQEDVENGGFDHNVTVTATDPDGAGVQDQASVNVQPAPTAALTLDKSVSSSDDVLGGSINYDFVVTNSGNQTINNIVLTDDGVGNLACPQTTLAPGESMTCTGVYEPITVDDIVAEEVTNTGTVTGTPTTGPDVTATDTVTHPIPRPPAEIILDKQIVSGDPYDSVGDVIEYQYVVENISTLPISNIEVTDDVDGGAVTCPQTELQPGESMVCTATYTISQDDLDAGQVESTAVVQGEAPDGTTVINSDSQRATADGRPSISIDTTSTITDPDPSNPDRYQDGSTINYSYVVSNDGNVTLNDVGVTDTVADNVVCPQTTLAPGESMTCTGSYTATQQDVDNGSIQAESAANGTAPDNTTVSDTAVVTDIPSQEDQLSVTVQADISSFDAAGTDITYTYTVTNEGARTATGVAVTDDTFAGLTCNFASLAPGESGTCTYTHTTTEDDIANGGINNTATASGTNPDGNPITPEPTDSENVTATPVVELSLQESIVSGNPYDQVGDVIEYEFVVSNVGNLTVDNIAVADDVIDGAGNSVSCPQATLAPGENMTCTGSYTVTQDDLDNGSVVNTSTVTGTGPASVGDPAPVQDGESALATVNPDITIQADVVGGVPYGAVGDVLDIEYVVQNTGNVTLDNVEVTDSNGVIVTCSPSTLSPGESVTCTGQYMVTQADVDAGTVTGDATATGQPPGVITPPTATDNYSASGTVSTDWTLDKTSPTDPNSIALNSNIDYEYLLTNTGNVSISAISVTDDKVATVTCPQDTLAPAETMTCTGAYGPVSQAEIDAGSITNVATATGTPASGTLADATDTLTIDIGDGLKGILIDKQIVSGNPYAAVGDVIEYSYRVENIGELTLSSVSVSDNRIPTVTCPQTELTPTESMTCTASYTVTLDDMNAGQVVNIATANATASDGNPVTNQDSQTAEGTQSPALDIVKELASIDNPATGTTDRYQNGSTLNYTVTVTNTGNVTITAVTVDDPDAPMTCTGGPDLDPADSLSCTGSYTTDQADVDAGEFTNTATADGTPPAGTTLAPVSDSVTAFPVRDYALSLTKNADIGNVTVPGTVVTYTYVVTNSGTATLTDITLDDDQLGAIAGCAAATLDPGADTTCTAQYTVTEADIIAGGVTNVATANGTGGGAPVAPPGTATETVTATPQADFTLQKTITANDTYTAVGDIIEYAYDVINVGNVTIDNIAVADDVVDAAGGSVSCPQTTLAPATATTAAESMTCTASYTVTQADLDSGSVTNVATLTGDAPAGVTAPDQKQDSETAFAVPNPSLDLVKSIISGNPFDAEGDVIEYQIVVTNDGNVTITDVIVADVLVENAGGAITCDVAAPIGLAPTESTTCTASYTVTQDDVNNRDVDNTATANGTSPGAVAPPAEASDTQTASATQNPELTVEKTAIAGDPFTAEGDVIDYSYLVTNTGNISLTNLAVADDVIDAAGGSVTCPVTTLEPADTTTCTASYTVTLADTNAGSVTNTATASANGSATSGDPADATDSYTALGPDMPELTTTKTVVSTPPNPVYEGATITYGYSIENTGPITVNNITLDDDKIGTIACPETTLDPGASMNCSNTDYTVTQADINAGSVTNNTITAGDTTAGAAVTPVEDTETVNIAQTAAFIVNKENVEKDPATQEVPFSQVSLTYTYVVTNTGNLPLSNIDLTDDLVGVNCPQTTLDPATTTSAGESMTCTSDTYTITDADRGAGSVTNTVTATGTGVNGVDPADATDDEIVYIGAQPRQLEPVTPAGWWLNCNFPGESGQYTPGAFDAVDPNSFVDRECKYGFPPGLLPTLYQELQDRGETPPYYPFSSSGFPAGFPDFTGTPDNTYYDDYSRIITP